jgi:hypothetical protein
MGRPPAVRRFRYGGCRPWQPTGLHGRHVVHFWSPGLQVEITDPAAAAEPSSVREATGAAGNRADQPRRGPMFEREAAGIPRGATAITHKENCSREQERGRLC